MCKRMICILLALLCFVPSVSCAESLEEAVSSLSDDTLLQLYSVAVMEIYQRGFTEEEVAAYVSAYYQKQEQTTVQTALPDVFGSVRDVLKRLPEAGTAGTTRSTPKPTFAPLVQLDNDDIVWISNTGKRYHTTPDCSGMKNPSEVTLESALSRGLTPCRDCAYWMAETGE